MNKKLAEYHKDLLGEEFPLFEEWVSKPLRKSIRVNPIRTTPDEFREELDHMGAEGIPWCEEGFWVDDGTWGSTIPHQLGYYYMQEAASMVPGEALAPDGSDTVLDMAAAPGSKTTQVAPFCGTIVANEPNPNRREVLFSNVNRCGLMNCIITSYDGARFPDILFDKVLVDAMCSNIGNARKDRSVLERWHPSIARRMSVLQKRLLSSAFNLLKPGGRLVYSTCTSSLEENEEVVLWLLDSEPDARLEGIKLPIKSRPGLLDGTGECMRIHPWDNDTEFFFVARISNG